MELVVELAAERQVQRPGAGVGGIGKAQRGALELLVEGDAARPRSGLRPRWTSHPLSICEVQGVEDDLVDALVHLDGDDFACPEKVAASRSGSIVRS